MTRALALLTVAAASLHGAVIRGTVVENFTGKLLTRALVVLQPLGATPGDERTARTGRLGGFEFNNLPAGVYLLRASRRGFLPIEYGQKRWNSAGEPIVLEASASTFLNIRLPRYGAVSGTVVDENDIGLPDHDVSVYRATKPPELIRQDKTDDRGQYRIGGLTPGKYLVRTGGGRYPDGSYLPTFSRETTKLDDAQIAEVFLEQQTDHIDVRPLPGETHNLSVGIMTDPPHLAVTLTLAWPMGRRTVQVVDSHTFTGLAPGDYEVYAETLPDAPHQGAWQRIHVPGRGVNLLTEPAIAIPITGDSREKGVLWVRRRDLAGPGLLEIVPGQGAELAVGRWDILPRPPDGFHVSGVYGAMMARRDRPDGWNEVSIARYSRPQIRIAGGAASIRGTVKDAPYAPVYLEGWDPQNRIRVGELWVARADEHGRYRFENLGPGAYRILATFEYLAPESETFDLANAPSLTLDAHGAVARDLDLWVIR